MYQWWRVLMSRQHGNRDALLNGAVHCIQERGYGQTTARDLVAASGTNLGAIGYHFGSKEALLNEALMHCIRQWINELTRTATQSLNDDGDWWQAIVAAAHRSIDEQRPVARGYIEAWAQAQRSPQLRDQLAEHYREIRAALAALVIPPNPDSPVPDAEREATAVILTAVCDGLLVQWMLDPTTLPDVAVLARTLAPLLPGNQMNQ
jgi:AcrR family transcriptional regulator